MIEKKPIKKSTTAMFIFYFLIGFEILYMISPFGIYYYSVYGKGLNLFNSVPFFRWMNSFFLPHIATTNSEILNSIKDVGWTLASIGFISFCVGAFQIYYGKLRNKGAVTGGIYNIIRHPQYSSLIVCSFGLLLVWPRFLVLFMFITMLFTYYFLARSEEHECEVKFGESYTAYMKKTNMFFPFKMLPAVNKIYLPSKGLKRALVLTSIYLVSITASLSTAYAVKILSIKALSRIESPNQITVSLIKMDREDIQNIQNLVFENTDVKELLNRNADNTMYLNYLMPVEWYMSDIPMTIPHGKEGHSHPHDYNAHKIKMLITKVETKNGKVVQGENILKKTKKRIPVVMVYIDLKSGTVSRLENQTLNVRWGNIPTPLF